MMLEPIKLFDQLDKSKSSIKTLRKAQFEILTQYFANLRKESRIGIKLPTGSGKSLIAILILEAWRREGKTVAILTANKGLAEDMKLRCEELGIQCATIFSAYGDDTYRMRRTLDLLQYKKAQKIGIFNYYSYLYGTEYKQEISPPDILAIDDASEFEIPRNDFFTVRIGREQHDKVYGKIVDALSEYSHLYPNLHDFKRNSSRLTSIELVYFTHADKVWKTIRDNLPELMKENDFSFSYSRNLKALPSSLVFISNDEIEIRPLLSPESSLKMGNIEQTIFMSATLPDEELLHKIFGIGKSRIFLIDESQISEQAFKEIQTLGKRLVFPLDLAELRVQERERCKEIIEILVKCHKKVLVLTNSRFEADSIQKYLTAKGVHTVSYSNPDDGRYFAQEVESGALICANRYLGLDFPGKTCQVEVIVRLPSIWDTVDAFQLSVLNNSYYVEQRVANRLIQSLGRCNRLVTDEALYYILDSRILSRIAGEEQYLRYFPQNLFGELMTGYVLSEGGDVGKAIAYGEKSFFGFEDPKFREFLSETKKQWSPPKIDEFVSKYDLEIEAWEKSIAGSYEASGEIFDFVGEDYKKNCGASRRNLEALSAFNFYLSAMNHYLAFQYHSSAKSKTGCLKELKKAIEQGCDSSWFNNLRAIYNELVGADELEIDFVRTEVRQCKQEISLAIDDFISHYSSKRRNWKDTYNGLGEMIQDGTHGQMVDALQRFFELLGFKAIKGDNDAGEPDLMAFSPAYEWKYILSIEAKTKEKGEKESKESVAQVLADSGVIKGRYKEYEVHPVLITQKEDFDTKAVKAAERQVVLLTTTAFSTLIQKTYENINTWAGLSAKNKSSFIDSFISSYELKKIFEPKEDPVVQASSL